MTPSPFDGTTPHYDLVVPYMNTLNDGWIENMVDEKIAAAKGDDGSGTSDSGTSTSDSEEASSDLGGDSDTPPAYSFGPCCAIKIEEASKESVLCDCFLLSAFTGIMVIVLLTVAAVSLVFIAQPDPQGFWGNFVDIESVGDDSFHIKPGQDPDERVVMQLMNADGDIEILGVYKREAVGRGAILSASAVLKIMLHLTMLLIVCCSVCYLIVELLSIGCPRILNCVGWCRNRRGRARKGHKGHEKRRHHHHESRRRRKYHHRRYPGKCHRERNAAAQWV